MSFAFNFYFVLSKHKKIIEKKNYTFILIVKFMKDKSPAITLMQLT